MFKLYISTFIIVVLHNILTLTNVYTVDVNWTISSTDLDQYFMENIIHSSESEILCEHLTRNEKLAICNYIFNRPIFTKYNHQIYLNRNAFSQLSNDCKEKKVSFQHKIEYNEQDIRRNMFDCYGRHEPMRTSWFVDDAIHSIHISRGASQTEYCIFKYIKHEIRRNDEFILTDCIRNLNIHELEIPDVVSIRYLMEEKNSLERPYCNSNIEEIEVNYLREHSTMNYGNILIYPYKLCELSVERKILACQLTISHPNSQLHNIVIDKNAFNVESAECVTKTLHFQYYTDENSSLRRNRAMMPCYGKLESNVTKRWYLADGFRKLSILVLVEMDDNEGSSNNVDLVKFFEFHENSRVPMGKPPGCMANSLFCLFGFKRNTSQ